MYLPSIRFYCGERIEAFKNPTTYARLRDTATFGPLDVCLVYYKKDLIMCIDIDNWWNLWLDRYRAKFAYTKKVAYLAFVDSVERWIYIQVSRCLRTSSDLTTLASSSPYIQKL